MRANHAVVAVVSMLSLVIWLNSADAALLVQYDFTGEAGDQMSSAADMVAAGLTASGLTRGPGLAANTSTGSINSTGWTTGASYDASDYYAFSVTANPGWTMTLDSIEFGERRSGTGIRNWEIRSDLDAFANAVGSGSVPDDLNTRNHLVTLPATTFANLQGTVEFRIYGFSAEALTGTWRLTSTYPGVGVEIQGAAVPEPSGAALIAAMGLAGFAVCQRHAGARKLPS